MQNPSLPMCYVDRYGRGYLLPLAVLQRPYVLLQASPPYSPPSCLPFPEVGSFLLLGRVRSRALKGGALPWGKLDPRPCMHGVMMGCPVVLVDVVAMPVLAYAVAGRPVRLLQLLVAVKHMVLPGEALPSA